MVTIAAVTRSATAAAPDSGGTSAASSPHQRRNTPSCGSRKYRSPAPRSARLAPAPNIRRDSTKRDPLARRTQPAQRRCQRVWPQLHQAVSIVLASLALVVGASSFTAGDDADGPGQLPMSCPSGNGQDRDLAIDLRHLRAVEIPLPTLLRLVLWSARLVTTRRQAARAPYVSTP